MSSTFFAILYIIYIYVLNSVYTLNNYVKYAHGIVHKFVNCSFRYGLLLLCIRPWNTKYKCREREREKHYTVLLFLLFLKGVFYSFIVFIF